MGTWRRVAGGDDGSPLSHTLRTSVVLVNLVNASRDTADLADSGVANSAARSVTLESFLFALNSANPAGVSKRTNMVVGWRGGKGKSVGRDFGEVRKGA